MVTFASYKTMEDLVMNDLDVFIEHDIKFWTDYEENLKPPESHESHHIWIFVPYTRYLSANYRLCLKF